MNRTSLATLVAFVALASPAAAAPAPVPITLDPIGRTAPLGEGGTEISAFHARSKRVFSTNAASNRLDIYDLAVPSAPALIDSVDLAPYGGGPNSVAVTKGGTVAVAVQATPKTDPGSVQFFNVDGDRLCGVTVGALPDMVTFTDSERGLLVANEGEPSAVADPVGSVSVLDWNRDPCAARVRTAGFDATPLLNSPRIVTPGNTPAKDFEPEYIATEGSLAWVTIQEANAIGVLDIRSARFMYVRGLGYKDHGLAENALDVNDKDGPLLGTFPGVRGMYQPDAIAVYRTDVFGGIRLVTANEGDAREFGIVEEERVAKLSLDATAFPAAAKAALARLNVTKTMGDTDGDGDYDELYAFGGRSMSVLHPSGAMAFDTGSELERYVRDNAGATFNASHSETPIIDDRSDNKGPEPEAIAVGKINGRTYSFVGAERQGGIFAYDLDAKPGEAMLAGYANTRPLDRGPEGAVFVAKGDSPTRKPLLLTTNEISGTIAVFELRP